MNIDHFLVFWSAHNAVIIEALIALILFAVAFLTYNSVFGKKDVETGSGSSLDTTQIEQTLQKILASQSPQKVNTSSSSEVSASTADAMAEEVMQLRQALQEKQSQVESLTAQLATASAGAGAAPAAAPSPAMAGLSSEERKNYENRISELEARLAEYEIISEDIADLSKYKEENAELQKEIEKIKSQAGAAASPAPAESKPAPAVEEVIPEPTIPEPVAAAEPVPEPAATPEPAAPAAEAPAAEAPAAEAPAAEDNSSLIDDDLMKEFAAAVEGQKAGSLTPETGKLMDDFENFIKKG